MKPLHRCAVLLALALSFGSLSTYAISLDVIPSTQGVSLGRSVSIELAISGLGDLSAPSLGVFDLDVLFDETILDFNAVDFGDPVLGDQLALVFPSLEQSSLVGPGQLNLFELSFDLPEDLDLLQMGTFKLAKVTFDALDFGKSPIDISVNTLGDAFGAPLTPVDVRGGTVRVPEPTTLTLLFVGLLGFGLIKGRKGLLHKN